MAPYSDDDWSDSDEELESVETSVLLGVPDVPVDAESDLNDAAVSRIGGKPAFLSSAIPFESSQCNHCKNPMELLVQLWCPLEDSAYDRAMYVWGCARATCQRQPGTVRAWRGLRYNEEYASKLAKKRAKPAAKPDERSETSADRPKVNPFAMTGDSGSAAALGLGSDLFGASPVFEGANHGADDPETVEDDGDDSSDDSSVESVVVALASATLADSPWKSAPSYPPLYLSTLVEYVEPEKSKVKATQADISMDEASEAQNNWPAEKYENSLETDHVFDRFSQRISTEPHQCVRYDLYGIPLPFCTDETYKRLFPLSDGDPTVNIVTRSAFAATSKDASRRTYDPRTLPTCPVCGENRVFECQLMPNLINVAKDDTKNTSPASNGDHRQELESLLAGKGVHSRGMEWGTILVFTCEKDCCPSRDIGWHEEHVLVQWDS